MKQHLLDFLNYLKFERALSNNTIISYKSDLIQLQKHLKSNPLTQQSLSSFLTSIELKILAPKTLARKKSCLKSFCHFLKQEKRLEFEPDFLLEVPKQPLVLPRALKIDELETLISMPTKEDSFPYRDSALLELLYGSGLRVSECTELQINSFKKNDLLKVTGKGKKDRFVPISTAFCRVFKDYLTKERPNLCRNDSQKTVFLNKNGRPLSRQGLFLMIKKYAKRAGLAPDTSPHTLRHSFATHLLDGEADIREVQELLGHQNVSSTQIYLTLSKKRLKKIFNQSHPRETKNK